VACHSGRWPLGHCPSVCAFDGKLVDIDGPSPLEMVGQLVAIAGSAPLEMLNCWIPVKMNQGSPLEMWHCLRVQGVPMDQFACVRL